jgi:hypothetical protein
MSRGNLRPTQSRENLPREACRPGDGNLAPLIARKEVGVLSLLENPPALIEATQVETVNRPRNICSILCPPCTVAAAPRSSTYRTGARRTGEGNLTCGGYRHSPHRLKRSAGTPV